MLKHLFSDCLVIGAFIFVSLLAVGCGRENIFDMHIEDVEIDIAAIDPAYSGEPMFLVIARVTGFAGGTDCYGHHETTYLQTGDYAGAPLYPARRSESISLPLAAVAALVVTLCPHIMKTFSSVSVSPGRIR